MTAAAKELLFLALGGSGEIGMNANLYGCDGKFILIDLGVSFGSQEYPGIDLIMPDMEWIEDRLDDLLAIVLTHGHEDHIGALPYLAADLGVPLYANRFTAGLIAGKLAEQGIADVVKLNAVDIDAQFKIGPFGLRFVPLAHSIPEMSAVVIDTPYGRVFHSGDWKLDDDPVLGKPTAEPALRKLGDEGIDVLVCDSTNAFNPQASGSEGSVRAGLIKAVSEAKGRAIITTFASNAARLQTLGEVARECGRHLVRRRRSLDRILGVAQANGFLTDFPETVDFDTAMTLPRGDLMVIATGGQGEPRAALGRMADDNHQIKLQEGDSVIFSSKQIPGNELAIGRIMNQLAAKGVLTVTEKQAHIHVSGHPGQPELAAHVRLAAAEAGAAGARRNPPHARTGALCAGARRARRADSDQWRPDPPCPRQAQADRPRSLGPPGARRQCAAAGGRRNHRRPSSPWPLWDHQCRGVAAQGQRRRTPMSATAAFRSRTTAMILSAR